MHHTTDEHTKSIKLDSALAISPNTSV